MKIKTGIGFDAHSFNDCPPLMLGGIEIPFHKGLKGHSDADVLIHAIIDCLAGAGLNADIGKLFPDTVSEYKGIDSKILLKKTVNMVYHAGFSISNIDSELIMQQPRIGKYLPEMQTSIADVVKIETEDISIKATTTEKMGFTGRGEGIAAIAACLLQKK